MGGFGDRPPLQVFPEEPAMTSHHNRIRSADAFRAKRNKRNPSSVNVPHQRKPSKHRTYSNMSNQSFRGTHRQKQPSKQEILLDSEDNENIRDSMARIFEAFDDFETTTDHKERGSQDIGGMASGIGSNALSKFSLHDIQSSDESPIRAGGGDDFFNFEDDDPDIDRFGMP